MLLCVFPSVINISVIHHIHCLRTPVLFRGSYQKVLQSTPDATGVKQICIASLSHAEEIIHFTALIPYLSASTKEDQISDPEVWLFSNWWRVIWSDEIGPTDLKNILEKSILHHPINFSVWMGDVNYEPYMHPPHLENGIGIFYKKHLPAAVHCQIWSHTAPNWQHGLSEIWKCLSWGESKGGPPELDRSNFAFCYPSCLAKK